MKNKASLITTLLILATGVILAVAYNLQDSTRVIIFISGASFMIAALINAVMLCDNRDREGRRRRGVFDTVIGWIVSVAGVALGLTMLITPDTFRTSLVYLFGGILVLAGVYQLILLMRGLPGYRYAGWSYILPLLVVADGCVMLFYSGMREDAMQRYVVLSMGTGLMLTALTNLVVYIEITRYNRRMRRGGVMAPSQPVRHIVSDDDDNTVTPSM